jgi:hypothetical protein
MTDQRNTIPPEVLATDETERHFAAKISDLEGRLAEVKARRDQHRRNVAAGLNAEPQSREDYLAERRAAIAERQEEEREFQERQKQRCRRARCPRATATA